MLQCAWLGRRAGGEAEGARQGERGEGSMYSSYRGRGNSFELEQLDIN